MVVMLLCCFKQKTAYEMRISDWSSDVCSSDRVEDDRCNPVDAVEAARRLAARGVVFVVGHVCSGSSIPASKVYQRRDVLMISPASTNPFLTDQGYNLVFRSAERRVGK